MSVIVCLVTCPSKEFANSLARELIDQQLAACVNVLPEVHSTYRWEGAVCVESEALMVIKSTTERQDELKRAVLSKHPYDTPEFVVLDTQEVSEKYAHWVEQSVGHRRVV